MIGRLEKTVLDCPDPRALAAFYAEVLGMQVTEDTSGDWVVIGREPGMRELAFQRAEDYRPPRWPDPGHPQQDGVAPVGVAVTLAEPRAVPDHRVPVRVRQRCPARRRHRAEDENRGGAEGGAEATGASREVGRETSARRRRSASR